MLQHSAQSPNLSGHMPVIQGVRTRLAKINVLVAEHDARTAKLLHDVLLSFGFKSITTVHTGQEAIDVLQKKRIDLLITEWEMKLTDGLRLVKIIRSADSTHGWERDLPTIMLTAKADIESVREARDAGVNEFVAKPFSAKSLSTRLLQIIDNPRAFVVSKEFVGPCRRRRSVRSNSEEERRNRHVVRGKAGHTLHEIIPPSKRLRRLIGEDINAFHIFTDQLVNEVQLDIDTKEDEFISWAEADIEKIEAAYLLLTLDPKDKAAREKLLTAAYAIKSQAGTFGYELGTEVSRMLIDYLAPKPVVDSNCLIVLGMNIDTIRIIFRNKIKARDQQIAQDLLKSLEALESKLG